LSWNNVRAKIKAHPFCIGPENRRKEFYPDWSLSVAAISCMKVLGCANITIRMSKVGKRSGLYFCQRNIVDHNVLRCSPRSLILNAASFAIGAGPVEIRAVTSDSNRSQIARYMFEMFTIFRKGKLILMRSRHVCTILDDVYSVLLAHGHLQNSLRIQIN
jgi:hypothetical protein